MRRELWTKDEAEEHLKPFRVCVHGRVSNFSLFGKLRRAERLSRERRLAILLGGPACRRPKFPEREFRDADTASLPVLNIHCATKAHFLI
jgi:hypothetical protein